MIKLKKFISMIIPLFCSLLNSKIPFTPSKKFLLSIKPLIEINILYIMINIIVFH
jgi:hypothetical protein